MNSARVWISAGLITLCGVMVGSANAQVASAFALEGAPLPSDPNKTVASFNTPDVNSLGGWAFTASINDPNLGTLSIAWGSVDGLAAPSILFSEGTYAGQVQSSWETTEFGLGDLGEIGYSATVTIGDSVWIDDLPVAIDGDPSYVTDQFWTFGSAPHMTADGVLYWAGGTSATSGGSTNLRGLFSSDGTTVLYSGETPTGLPAPLDDSGSPVGFDFGISTFGSHYIAEVEMETSGTGISTSADTAIVADGGILIIDGVPVIELNPVPASIGGQAGELWDNFDAVRINEFGEIMITGDTTSGAGGTSQDEFVYVNGQIIREGFPISGLNVNGSSEYAALNDNGDWAVVWDVDDPVAGNREALIVNNQVLVIEEVTDVDIDNDGIADPGARVSGTLSFSGTRSLAISNRTASNTVTVYFTADVSDNGAPEIEGAFAIEVPVTPGLAGDLAVAVSDSPDPAVVVPGQITYTVSVRNNGDQAATGVTVDTTIDPTTTFNAGLSDPIVSFAAGVATGNIGSIPPNGVVSYQVVVDFAAGGIKTATSTLSANEADPDLSNNTAVNETDAGKSTDLSVTLADDPDPVNDPNGLVTITVEATNAGPSEATGVEVQVTLDNNTVFVSSTAGVHDGSPTGGVVTAVLGTMPDDAVQSFDIVAEIQSVGDVTTTATITGNESDPDLSNNDASETTTFDVSADLQSFIIDSPDPITPVGGQITYDVSLTNDGPSPAAGVVATLTLDAGTQFVSTTAGAHDGSANGGVVTVNVGVIANGDTASYTVVVNTLAAGRLEAVAEATTTSLDPAPLNNKVPTYTLVYDTTPLVAKGVFSDIAGHPTNVVPGLPGASFSSFDQPFRSPNGKLWTISVDTDLATTMDELILVGTRCSALTRIQEGVSVIDPNILETVGLIDQDMGITDNGDLAFTTNSDGPTAADELVLKWNNSTMTLDVIAREGDFAAATGFNYSTSLGSCDIDAFGQVWMVVDTDGATDFDQFVLSKNGNLVQIQEGVTLPNGETREWDSVITSSLGVSADGSVWAVRGDMVGDPNTEGIFAVNNTIMLQEDVVIPGSGFSARVDSYLASQVFSDGSWVVRGDNNDQLDWIVRDGAVEAATDEPISAGSPERYSDGWFSSAFFGFAANNLGSLVIASTTNAGGDESNDDSDAVLVLNGEVVSREGDPVDLDGNGLLDDGVRINTYGNDDMILTDDYQLYTTATLRDDAGASVGDAFLRLNLCSTQVCGDLDGDGMVTLGSDYPIFLAAFGHTGCDAEYHNCADFDDDGVVGFSDYFQWLTCYHASLVRQPVDNFNQQSGNTRVSRTTMRR
jgi:uncharacterized repeat protein (TIGR01451 family)